MTQRRELLRSMGTASATGVVVSIAGCLGEDDDDDGVDDTDGEEEYGGTDPNDQEEAETLYDDAIEDLVTIEEILAELRPEEAERTRGDIESLEFLHEDANTTLADATALADGELAERISQAQTVADFQGLLIEANELGLETNEAISEAERLDDADQDDEAVDYYQQTLDLLEDQRQLFSELETAHAALETELIDEPTIQYNNELMTYLRIDGESELDHFSWYVEARRDISAAWMQLGAGEEAWQAGDFGTAQSEWESGRSFALNASDRLETLEEADGVDVELLEVTEILLFIAGTQWETFDQLVGATGAALDGDVEEAEQRQQDAYEYLGRQLAEL